MYDGKISVSSEIWLLEDYQNRLFCAVIQTILMEKIPNKNETFLILNQGKSDRIDEVEGTSGGLWCNLLLKAGLAMGSDQPAQGFVQLQPEKLWGQKIHRLCKQPVPLLNGPTKAFPLWTSHFNLCLSYPLCYHHIPISLITSSKAMTGCC